MTVRGADPDKPGQFSSSTEPQAFGQRIFRTCPACGSDERGPRFCTKCGADLVPPIEVTHAVGPMWAVNSQVFTVPASMDRRRTVLDAAADAARSQGSVRAVIVDGGKFTRVAIREDGSSVAEGDDASLWAGPARPPRAAASSGRVSVVGAHPGAGASTWAQLLGMPEADQESAAGELIVVCRSLPAGISATKRVIREVGTARVRAVLVIADAPGKPVPAAAREQKVLAGAVPVVAVPWMPRLRGATEISRALDGQLARAVQRVSKALVGASAEKKDKK